MPDLIGIADLPPLIWLRAFEAASRHASFAAAARELNLTPAAVSHQVRALEKHLGVVLFERLARKVRLTEIGHAYLPPVRRSFDEIAAATAGLFGPSGVRILHVQAPASFIAFWLAPRLAAFAEAHPGIALRLTSVLWSNTYADEGIDVEIRLGDGGWPGTRAELILRGHAIPVCAPGNVPAGDEPARLAALCRQRLVHVAGYSDLWQRLFEPYGLTVPPFRGLNVDTSMAALELAASGYGPAMVQEDFALPYLRSGRLARALDIRLPLETGHYLIGDDSVRRAKPEAVLFRNWLRREAAPGRQAGQSDREGV